MKLRNILITRNNMWNTKRAFSKKMKEEVMERDGGCIICGDTYTIELHHIYYWWEAEYWPNRNDANKIVWLCKQHHHELHFEWWNNWREICKTYQLDTWTKKQSQ